MIASCGPLLVLGLGTDLLAVLRPQAADALEPLVAHRLITPLLLAAQLAFPLGLGGAVLRGGAFGVDRLVRRALVTAGIWLALLAAYGLALDAAWRADGPLRFLLGAAWPAAILLCAAIAGSFWPLQAALRATLERALFRDTYALPQALALLGNEALPLTTLPPLVGTVLDRLGRLLDLEWATIELVRATEPLLAYRWGQTVSPSLPTHRVTLQGTAGPLGILAVGPKGHDRELRTEDRQLLDTLAPILGLAIERTMLGAQLQSRVDRLERAEADLRALTRRVVAVQEEERRRLALDLHDDAIQPLARLARRLGDTARDGDAATDRLHALALDALAGLRAACGALRPPHLDEAGLPEALRALARATVAGTTLDVRVADSTVDPAALDPALALALYRVAQEALANTAKHAPGATTVRIALTALPPGDAGTAAALQLAIRDDGPGLGAAVGLGPVTPGAFGGLGLLGMAERVAPWGGTVTVTTPATGGTIVLARVPLHAGIDAIGTGTAAPDPAATHPRSDKIGERSGAPAGYPAETR